MILEVLSNLNDPMILRGSVRHLCFRAEHFPSGHPAPHSRWGNEISAMHALAPANRCHTRMRTPLNSVFPSPPESLMMMMLISSAPEMILEAPPAVMTPKKNFHPQQLPRLGRSLQPDPHLLLIPNRALPQRHLSLHNEKPIKVHH